MNDKIYYESNNTLCGVLTRADKNSNKIVIMCHGIRGNKDEHNSFIKLANDLKLAGYSSFRFDFNGHGESKGNDYEMTIDNEIIDLEKTIEMLSNKGYKEFILLGASFGASIVSLLQYKKHPEIKGIVLWYGAIDYDYIKYGNLFADENKKQAEIDGYYNSKSFSGNDFKFGLELFNQVDKYKPYENLIKNDLPKLFIHGDADRAVPFELSKKISEKCKNSEFILIKNGDHTFDNSNEALESATKNTINFIKKYL